jgi:hypothetical protein
MTHAERSHTRRRLAERYGLHATSADIFRMVKLLAHGQATLVERQSRHVGRWRLDYQGQALFLVFDSQRRSIITALPPLARTTERLA